MSVLMMALQPVVRDRDGWKAGLRPAGFALPMVLCAFLLVPASISAGAACERPYLATINLDGSMEDWAQVLSTPENVTLDGDGTVVPCAGTEDRDCIVPGGSWNDLRRFAWTYDDTYFYLFAERFAGGSNLDFVYLHLDLDGDGFMSAGADRLLIIELDNNSSEVTLRAYDYAPADPAGDPLADAAGFADGYVVAGSRGALRFSDAPRATVTVDNQRFEAGVAWADLGLPGPVPAGFHLGLDARGDRENQTSDNLGGPDGGPGTTAFRAHEMSPPRSGAAPPAGSVLYTHRIENRGNLPDVYEIRAVSSHSSHVRIHSDPNGDGDPADGALLGLDDRGDGDFVDVADLVPGDSDGDTFPDTGVLAPGGTFDLIVEIQPRSSVKGVVEVTVVHATSSGGGCERSVRDQTAVGTLAMLPQWDFMAEPGFTVRFPHEIHNYLPNPVCVDLSETSALGWTYQIWSDPDGDGDPSDGAILADTCGGSSPDLQILAGEARHLVARAAIPLGTALGAVETLLLNADVAAPGNPRASVTDTLTVAETLTLSPSYLLALGEAKNAPAGGSLYFRHRLTHAGPEPESFRVSATAPPGNHIVTLLTDPNGDGLPGDGQIIPNGSLEGPLEGFGGTLPLLVRLDVDPATPPGTILAFDVTATAETNPSNSRTALDEAVVSLIAAYADPGFFLQERTYPLCGTVHAQARGLVPAQSDRYRFRWVDLNGPFNLRVTPFTSDAVGESTDHLDVDPSFTPGDYAVLLEEWNGLQWGELDRDEIVLQDFLQFLLLGTDKATYAPSVQTMLTLASFENAGPRTLQGTELRYLIRAPAGNLYLRPDGLFFRHSAGDWTWASAPQTLAAGQRSADAFGIGPVDFPYDGTYSVEVHALGTCGESMASASTTFEVAGDADGDGWSDIEELIVGSDPDDRDTDDDGILDPEDGSGDADGDTAPDALECDADGDTLPDSVEEGLNGLLLDPDTDLAAGCFRADGDGGATTTNRLFADTDGGGESDGSEDANGDGIFQAGEKDPLDGTDDPCSWLPPPEVGSLRVERRGDDLLVTWADLTGVDPCVTYRIFTASSGVPDDISRFTQAGSGLLTPVWMDTGAGTDGTTRYYIAAATGRIGGHGLLGHYLQ